MKNYIQNLFMKRKESNRIREFYNLENRLNSSISEIEKNHKLFTDSLEVEEEQKMKTENVRKENSDDSLNDFNTKKIVEMKNLKFLKYFAVFVEALLSYNAINLFLKETIGINLSKGSDEVLGIVTMLKSMIIAVPVAYIFLQGAIKFKNIDSEIQSNKNVLVKFWYNISWILAISVIPFLNLFLVYTHPGHETNSLWIFFSIITLLINIKIVNYSQLYNKMERNSEFEKKIKSYIENIGEEVKTRKNIIKNVRLIFDKLRVPANEFKRFYESFGDNKPELTLNPIYRIFLNTYIYYNQVLPQVQMTITNPPAEFGNYFQFLDKSISPKINLTKELGQSDNSQPEVEVNEFVEEESGNLTEDEIIV